jgi:quinol monooxygenase YgiN
MEKAFTYIWEYTVQTDHKAAFLKLYGPNGGWVNFFNRAEGYLGTDLHEDIDNSERFITIDFWASKEIRDNYRKQFVEEFNALDEAGELVTIKETPLGEFYTYRTDKYHELMK